MIVLESYAQMRAYVDAQKEKSSKIAFVPTMGALHEGHLSLIDVAKRHADITVCSIFVNPTQFNDSKDLEKYPRTLERDGELLKNRGCDVLFAPSVEEMYPAGDTEWSIDLGKLDKIWEGEHRPGHFQGVTQIVYKLFRLVRPDVAVFGQKDYQQVMVIKKMVELKNLSVEIITVPTERELGGLARSSRNSRLSAEGRVEASVIFKALNDIKFGLHHRALGELKDQAMTYISNHQGFEVEYLAICDADTLEEKEAYEEGGKYVAIIAVWYEGVRLIDNLVFN